MFARKGYHRTSVEDIIAAAEVSRGTFYNYFPSKRAIFGEILEGLFERIWERVKPIDVEGEVAAQVLENLHGLIETFSGDEDLVRIVFGEAVGLDDEADEALAVFYRRCRERLARSLRTGQEMGIVGAGDPEILAVSILGMIKEYWFHRMLGAKLLKPHDFLSALYGHLTAGFLRM